jgi:hypothetical protein
MAVSTYDNLSGYHESAYILSVESGRLLVRQ